MSDLLPGLVKASAPASDAEVVQPLMRLMTVYGVPDREAAEWATFWELWVEVLAGQTTWAIERASLDYRRRPDSEFFPKPGPFLAICEPYGRIIERALVAAQTIAGTTPLPADCSLEARYAQREDIRMRWIAACEKGATTPVVQVWG